MAYCLIDPNDIVFLAMHENKIIGVCALHQERKNVFKNLFVEILPNFRGKGISKKLLTLQYEYISSKKGALIRTNYSQLGEMRVKKYRNILSDEYKVQLLDN